MLFKHVLWCILETYVTAWVGRTLARRLTEREHPNCARYFPGSHALKGFLNYASFADSKKFHGNDKRKFLYVCERIFDVECESNRMC